MFLRLGRIGSEFATQSGPESRLFGSNTLLVWKNVKTRKKNSKIRYSKQASTSLLCAPKPCEHHNRVSTTVTRAPKPASLLVELTHVAKPV